MRSSKEIVCLNNLLEIAHKVYVDLDFAGDEKLKITNILMIKTLIKLVFYGAIIQNQK